MGLENFLEQAIKWSQKANFTLAESMYLVLAFIILLIIYYWSGLSEKINNLTGGKKAAVFVFIFLILLAFYYVFYKAGKFNGLLNNPMGRSIAEKITGFF